MSAESRHELLLHLPGDSKFLLGLRVKADNSSVSGASIISSRSNHGERFLDFESATRGATFKLAQDSLEIRGQVGC